MKLILHDELYEYNITITAELTTTIGNKIGDTKVVLSRIESLIWDAWQYRRKENLNAIAEEAENLASSIHEELTKRGYYKEVKDNETK